MATSSTLQEQVIEGYRLSPQQRRLWALQQQGLPSRACCALRLEGDLDRSALQKALASLIKRHEILRTRFALPADSRTPLQVIRPQEEHGWKEVDLGSLQRSEQQESLEKALLQEQLRRADLSDAPLDVRLLRLAPRRHSALLSLPSLCADPRSLVNLVEDLARAYPAALQGREVPPPAAQYLQFSEWQNELLQEEDAQEGIEYWQGRFWPGLARLRLPFESPSPEDGLETARLSRRLDPSLLPRIDRLVRRTGATRPVLLLACWQTLLWRLGNPAHIALGCAFECREYEDLQKALGLCAKRLPIAFHFEEGFRFEEVLRRLAAQMEEAAEWQDYFVPEEGQAGQLFSAGFEFESLVRSYSSGSLTWTIEELFSPLERFDLDLACRQGDGSIHAEFRYDGRRFRADDIEALAGSFEALLKHALDAPQVRISRLDILSAQDRSQLLESLNQTAAEFPQECVHQPFERQAARIPDRIAAVFEDEQLSFAALDGQAGRLARSLREAGVGPGRLAALFLERSLKVIEAMLGTLKAGGAYLPVNLALPEQGIELLFQEARPQTVLCQAGLLERLPTASPASLLDVGEGAQASVEPLPPSQCGATPQDLAYVLFTSGSTGLPKGVAIEHQQIANYQQAILQRLQIQPGASFALISTFAADLGNTSLYPSLASGGRLHVLSEERSSDPFQLNDYFRSRPVDYLKIVPSHLAALQATSEPSRALPLRCLVLGGEASRGNWVRRLQEMAPHCAIFNHYGPTEATVGVIAYGLAPGQRLADRISSLPLGIPLANQQVYLLDSRLQPVPRWLEGQIYIGGAGVARGYLGQPRMTADRFMPDPFSGRPGSRIYRTGDRARHVPGSGIEFLGRVDHQVKLRGLRIELGEIESTLAKHPAVQEAAVLIREEQPGDQRLVAFAVPRRGAPDAEQATAEESEKEAFTVSQLRRCLAEKLPEYMVPAHIVALSALPLNPNGKVDRKALSMHALEERHLEYEAPVTPSEELLAETWMAVLSVSKVGRQDSFFELGGHSLLATQLTFRIRQAFSVEIPLRTLFEAPSLAALARRIDEIRQSDRPVSPPLQRADRSQELPLSFSQQRLWFLDRLEPGNPFYNIPQALLLEGELDAAALRASLREVVRRHEVLRTRFPAVQGKPSQRIEPDASMPLPIVDLSACAQPFRHEELRRLSRREALRPFDLEAGPVWRALLARLGRQQHALLSTMHHIVSDLWSKSILVNEVAAFYQAFSSAQTPQLPELPIQYADFARWQRRWLSGEALQEQMDYWKERLAGAPAALDLPTDRSRPARLSYRGATQHFSLPEGLSQELKKLSREQALTPFMTLLAAFQVLLFRSSGQTDILVGSPIANRSRPETEGLIGFFLNTIVLRTSLAGNPDFQEVMRRVRETALGAYARQDIPFEHLVDELQPERSLSRTPLFQVMFTFLHAARDEGELAGLEVNELGSEAVSSKFDLTLSMGESGSCWAGAIDYACDLFDSSTIQRMLSQLRNLLASLASDPTQPVGEASLLSAAERWQLLGEWNETGTPYPRDETMAGLFEEQVAQRPEAAAVLYAGHQLSFGCLSRLSGDLARQLTRQGAGAEAVVGLFAHRSLELMIGLLGIVRSGAAYLPLDPGYPKERIERMLADSEPLAVLAQKGLEGRLPSGGWTVLGLQRLTQPEAVGGPVAGPVAPENLAYLVYTSGSTGVPKGVAVPNRAVVRLVKETRYAVLGPEESILLLAPISFDASTFEIWGSLLNGGRLVVPPPQAPTLQQLGQLVEQHAISTLHLSAVLFHLMVQEGLAPLTRLRQLYAGGDVLAPEHVRSVLRAGLACLVNSYGPSENTTYTSCHVMRRVEGDWESVPIGRPVPNSSALVLDRHGNLLPIGIPGELHCGGDGLARCYFGRPAASAARFVPHPFSWGERLCRSGDLARWRQDGSLEFLGRKDRQVKVRGYRIELGEIEARLAEHPQVRHCAVLAEGKSAEQRRLAAYLSYRLHKGRPALVESDLQAFLRERLPEYMIPSAFRVLEKMPLNPSGKVDRQALQGLRVNEQAAKEGSRSRPFVAPRDALELKLAQIWEEVLECGPIGVLDDFFERGGHSLLAVQLIARIESVTGGQIPLNAVFQDSTIEHLAQRLRQPGPAPGSPIVPIQPKGSRPPLFLVHPSGGSVFGFLELGRCLAPEQPLIGLQAPELDGGEPCGGPIEQVAQRYSKAVQEHQPRGPYCLGGHSTGGLVAFEMARQLQAKGESIALLALLDSKIPNSPRRSSKNEEAWMTASFGLHLGLKPDSLPWRVMRRESPKARLDRLYETVRRERLIPPGMERDRFQLLFQLFQAHSRAARRYRPPFSALQAAYFAAESTTGQAGSKGRAGSLIRSLSNKFSKPGQDWREAAALGVEVYAVPGNHFSMLRQPQVQVLAQQLKTCLKEAFDH